MATTLAEKIAVMQAAERGEEIEMKFNSEEREYWQKLDDPMWNWGDFDYRVKPKPQKFWVLFDTNGRVMNAGIGQTPDYLVMSNSNLKLEWYERTPR